MRFYSKKDHWLGLFIWGMLLISLALLIYSVISTGEWMLIVLCIVWVALIAFIFSIWFGTYYEFKEEGLLIRCGFLREFHRYERITRVCPSGAARSSVALSLDRMAVYVNNQLKTYISPREKQAFLDELRKRCPDAVRENEWKAAGMK